MKTKIYQLAMFFRFDKLVDYASYETYVSNKRVSGIFCVKGLCEYFDLDSEPRRIYLMFSGEKPQHDEAYELTLDNEGKYYDFSVSEHRDVRRTSPWGVSLDEALKTKFNSAKTLYAWIEHAA